MSESYQRVSPAGPDVTRSDASTIDTANASGAYGDTAGASGTYGDTAANGSSGSTADTAKQEAGALKDTAVGQAKDVAGSVKHEAGAVVGEAKTQAKDLFAQTQRELKEQANTQQQRVAEGLRSVSSELDSMSANSENPGVAADLVGQLSSRLSGAASWIGDRDPGSLLSEVKSYARRRPGTFIIGAAVLGLAAGRLTRALAQNAADEHSPSGAPAASTTPAVPPRPVTPPPAPPVETTPLYEQSSATRSDEFFVEGDRDVRSDTV